MSSATPIDGNFLLKEDIFTKKTFVLLLVTALIYILSASPLEGLTQDNIPSSIDRSGNMMEYNIIGHSSRGAVIYNVIITPPKYSKTLLLTFAMHGFEGSWNEDGGALVQIANDLIREFSSRPEELQNTRLIIVPCVNPDGVWFGKTDKGFGRCNSQGIDINRDFDYHWEFNSESKYRTGRAPFTTPEARALRDMVLKEKPDAIIDFHGWLNCTYGDAELGSYFYKAFGIKHQSSMSKDKVYMQQYFTGWASQFTRTVMVEYPNPVNPGNINKWGYSYKTIYAVKELCGELQHVSSSK